MSTNGLIYKNMVSVMKDIEAIAKERDNLQQKYKFRGVDDVYNAVNPLFKKHGIFCSTKIISDKREVYENKRADGTLSRLYFTILDIEFSYYAEDGSFVTSVSRGEAMDSGDKSGNKAMSAAQKYSIIQMFCIPTVDGAPDSDKSDAKPVDDARLKKALDDIKNFKSSSKLVDWGNDQVDLYENDVFLSAVREKINELRGKGM